MYKLIIEDDEGKTTVVPLIRDEITIGRKEGNTIRLTERNVSRRHAKLLKASGAVYIEDLQSYNGIKVNGEKIVGRAAINEGDRIQIGDYQLALKIERQADIDGGDGDKTTPWPKDGVGLPASAAAPTRLTPQLSAKPPEEKFAKVVVVSSNFAGQEFSLDKPTMVIGRTDDNDIVINHRSISRHHAQIIREAGHYHIVDMGSANGVRVNGEDYGKVELRKGDHIDLGHVRLRFVAPGEDFIFIRDAEVIDVNAGGKGKSGGMIAAIAVGVAVVVGGAVVYKLVSKPADGGDDVAKANLELDNLTAAKRWEDCLTLADKVLAKSTQTAISDKKRKCEEEKENQVKFDKFSKLVADSKNEAAVGLYDQIPDSSVYKDEAKRIFAPVKKLYVMQQLESARKAATCAEATNITDAITIIDPTNVEAASIVKAKCGATAPPHTPRASGSHSLPPPPRAGEPPTPRAGSGTEPKEASVVKTPEPKVVEPKVEPVKPPPPPPAAGGGAEAKVNEAFDLYIKGNYDGALSLAESVKGADLPADAKKKLWKTIGAASCMTGDQTKAIAARNHLDPASRQFLTYVCHKKNIDLPP